MPKPCPDCGPDAVVHWIERWSAILDRLFRTVFKPLDILSRFVSPLTAAVRLDYVFIPFFKVLAFLRLGTITHEVDDKDTLRTRAIWESAMKRGITLWQFRLFGRPQAGFCVAHCPAQGYRVFEGLPRPRGRIAASLEWMDDKGTMKRKFAEAGLPVAHGAVCTRYSQALAVLRQVGGSVIAKPHLGSRSRHTTTHIFSPEELKIAFDRAKQLSPWVVVEEELRGPVVRATLVGGRVVAVVRRDFPTVVGDGVSTIRQLVEKENKNPKRRGPVFHVIPLDYEAEAELRVQSLGLESVPEKGRAVKVGTKMSRSLGATTADVTVSTHQENILMLEKAARVLADPLVGIDFMMEDTAVPWFEQDECGIIECNSLPFIDLHHYPYEGRSRDVGGAIWTLTFPKCTG